MVAGGGVARTRIRLLQNCSRIIFNTLVHFRGLKIDLQKEFLTILADCRDLVFDSWEHEEDHYYALPFRRGGEDEDENF